MKTLKLTIETKSPLLGKAIAELANLAITNGSNDLDKTLDFLKSELATDGSCLKVGRGGNHVWISMPNNERIAIIN